MKYPKMNEWFSFNRIDAIETEVVDKLSGEKSILPTDLVDFLVKLDGKTNPYTINKNFSRKDVNEYLDFFADCKMIKRKRFVKDGIGTFLVGLYMPKNISEEMRVIGWLWNTFLKFSFIPILVIGAIVFIRNLALEGEGLFAGVICGMLIGLPLHEFSHACATISCKNGEFYEFGIGMYSFLPMAYVIINERNIGNRLKRIQIYLAGCEANLLIGGIALMLAGIFHNCSMFFFSVALQNIFIAALNLTFNNGFDGMAALSEIVGCKKETFIRNYRRVIFIKNVRKRIINKGTTGKVFVFNCYVLFALKIAIPIFYVSSILEVIVQ